MNKYDGMSPEAAIEAKKSEVTASMERLRDRISVKGQLVTPERDAILSLDFPKLLQNLREGNLKATRVLEAFQAKALVETSKTNCITEFVPHAELWAKERDAMPKEKRGVFHGLPVSIKENFDIEGMETTLGLTKRLGQNSESTAVIVRALLHEGAIPFVKTNIPQIVFSAGCSNPIYGATSNPVNRSRSPGGSSGGEAALIFGGGSVLGVGSDMLGSVRIPASFCGIPGIKPTQRRISKNGSYGTYPNMIGISNGTGFLGREVDALVGGMRAVCNSGVMSSLDPVLPLLPWNEAVYGSSKPLRVGYFVQDEFLPVSEGCKRAIEEAKKALTSRGHELIPFEGIDLEEVFEIGWDIILSEGGSAMLRLWEGEIVDASVETNKRIMAAPSIVKMFFEKFTSFWSTRIAKMASQKAKSSSELWNVVGQLKVYTDKLIKRWKKHQIDILLGPSMPLPAPHPETLGNLMSSCIYIAMYNLVDFPAGVVPVTFQTESDDCGPRLFSRDKDYIFDLIKKECEGAVGLPLCVQVAGLPWQEELVLRALKEIELGLKL